MSPLSPRSSLTCAHHVFSTQKLPIPPLFVRHSRMSYAHYHVSCAYTKYSTCHPVKHQPCIFRPQIGFGECLKDGARGRLFLCILLIKTVLSLFRLVLYWRDTNVVLSCVPLAHPLARPSRFLFLYTVVLTSLARYRTSYPKSLLSFYLEISRSKTCLATF